MMLQLRSLVGVVLVATAVAGVVAIAAAPGDGFVVTGRIYCDNCRAGFETNVSHPIEGATVEMECRHFQSQQAHDKAQATTGPGGWYKMEIDGDHQDEICDVRLLKSPEADCAEIDLSRDRCRVPLTRNDGIKQSGVRYANPIAFLRKEPLPKCGELLRAYDLYNETSENS